MAKSSGSGGANRRLRAASIAGGAAGSLGGLACSVSMILAAAGVIGAAGAGSASSMAGMRGMDHVPARTGADGVSGFLLDHGPAILITSVILVTASLALRRPWTAGVAAAVGALMYWGMYVQQGLTVMYLTIAVGLATWLTVLIAARRPSRATDRLDV